MANVSLNVEMACAMIQLMKTSAELREGISGGMPIGLGYLSVSFAFGILAAQKGFPWWAALLMSLTSLSSAGQLAGITVMVAGGGYFELAVTILVINLRYALMSTAISQKLSSGVRPYQRFFLSLCITDEIFALGISRDKPITVPYFMGALIAPYLGWSLGTLIGSVGGSLLPSSIVAVLSIALYGMFIAIITPAAAKDKGVAIVCIIAIVISCLFYYVPIFSSVTSGVAIIIVTFVAATLGAVFFPIKDHQIPHGDDDAAVEEVQRG